MKYPKTFERYVFSLCEIMRQYTFTVEYKITVRFSETPSKSNPPGLTTTAEVVAFPQYLEATITIYPFLYDFYKKKEWIECANAIAHELGHIVIWPVFVLTKRKRGVSKKVFDDAENQSVQRITNMILMLCKETDWSPQAMKKRRK